MRSTSFLLCILTFPVAAIASPSLPPGELPLDDAAVDKLIAVEGPLRAEHVNQTVLCLLANYKAHVDNNIEPYPRVLNWLHQVKADTASAQAVGEAIGEVRGLLEAMYVANHLLVPFMHTGNNEMPERETAAVLIEPLENIEKRGRYKRLPPFNEKAAERLAMPEAEAVEKMDAERLLRHVARIQRRRDQKHARELPVIINNQLLWDLQIRLWRMKILASTPETATEIAQAAVELEKEGNGMFIHILRSIKDSIKRNRLDKETCQAYWDVLVARYETFKNMSEEKKKELPDISGGLVNFKAAGVSGYKTDTGWHERRHAYPDCLNQLGKMLNKSVP
jgi:hypothetical protein